MRFLRVAAILALAVLFAAQLILHNHSLIPETGGTPPLLCAVCAFGADSALVDAPLLAAALILIGILLSASASQAASASVLAAFGRAPPVRF